MAILDKELRFSEAQAITASGYSTNFINKGDGGMLGKDMILVAQTKGIDFAAGGAATLVIELRTSDTNDGTDLNGTVKTLFRTAVLAIADLTKNKIVMRLKTPPKLLKYLQVYHTVATGPFTAGALDTQFQKDVEVTHDETP